MNAIVCVTNARKGQVTTVPALAQLARELGWYFLVGSDGAAISPGFAYAPQALIFDVSGVSRGYYESLEDYLLEQHVSTYVEPDEYVLRLDDDEFPSASMRRWLLSGFWTARTHWKFSRAHLWGDADHYIANLPLWPDHQTRMSIRKIAGGRKHIHSGSPFGGGHVAPCGPILHAKFLIKSLEERMAIAAGYDRVSPGTGTSPGMLPFQTPEQVWSKEEIDLRYVKEFA